MHGLQKLLSSDLPIPLWQIVFYAGLVSYFMFRRWFKVSFLTSFILVLYWLHYAFRPDLVEITSEAHLARAIYYVLGFALILLSIFALTFLEVDAESLLDKREKEITILKAQAKNAEKNAAALQAQLDQDHGDSSSAEKKRDKKLTAKIEKLEKRLQESESLLKTRESEISELQAQTAEAQKNASAIEALLDMYQNQESNSKKKLEEELNARIEALQVELREGESVLEQRDTEISALRARAVEAESDAASLKTQLQDALDTQGTPGVEGELNERIDQLRSELATVQTLLDQRVAEAAEFKARAAEAEKQVEVLKSELDQDQQESVSKKKLEEKFNARISKLENQLKQNEKLLERRKAENADLQAKAADAERRAAALKSQFDKERGQESTIKNRLAKELNARITKLEDQLKASQSALDARITQITELEARALQAESDAAELREQLQEDKLTAATAGQQREQELTARIDKLENELKQSESQLQKRDAEISQLQIKADEAEKNAANLARLERDQHSRSAANSKLEKELNAKIASLEDKLQQDQTLLENRNSEISALKANVAAAAKETRLLAAQIEEEKTRTTAAQTKLEDEFNSTIARLEKQLQHNQGLLEERDAEINQLKAQASEAEKNALSLKNQLEKDSAQTPAAKKMIDELRARVTKLEGRLTEGETLLKARNSEIAALQAKASQAEKSAAALKTQLEKEKTQASSENRKLETELHAKIAQLETQLKERESALEKRDAKTVDYKIKAAEALKGASAGKQPAVANRQTLQAQASDEKNASEEDVRRKLHQFQYAVKYLEDEIKEKDRLLGLMAKKHAQAQTTAKPAVDEDLKKKVHQLEQTVKYLENQSQEKDGLLSLMAKRNRELADLKSKAEERLEALEASHAVDDASKSSETDIASER